MPPASGLGLNRNERPLRSLPLDVGSDVGVKRSLPSRIQSTAVSVTTTIWKPLNADEVSGMVDKSFGVRVFAPILNVFFVYAFLNTLYQPGGWMPDTTREVLYTTAMRSLLPIALSYRLGKVLYDFRGALASAFVASAVIAATVHGSAISASLAFSLVAVPVVRLLDYGYEMGMQRLGLEMSMPITYQLIAELYFGVLMVLASVAAYEAAGPVVDWSVTAMKDATVELIDAWKPLSAMIIEPAKVLFIDAEVEQHLITSGNQLLSSNPGTGAGLLIAILVCGPQVCRPASVIALFLLLFAGPPIVYFPFCYMHPLTIVALVAGGALGSIVLDSSEATLKQAMTTKSLIDLAESTTDGDGGKVVAAVLVSAVVTFLVSCVLLMPRHKLMKMTRPNA